MKKLLTLFAFTLMAFTTNAQAVLEGDMNHDGELSILDVMKLVNIILGNEHQSYLTCPDDNHPHLIDLGLPSGTKWACCNVGAPVPEGFGGYYSWGETEEKSVYNWSTYIHCDGSSSTCHDLGYSICGTEYDVAHVNWGEKWEMPTITQIKELINNCSYEWIKENGIRCGKFTGSNGGTILIPAVGEKVNTHVGSSSEKGWYWAGMEVPDGRNRPYLFGVDIDGGRLIIANDRYRGMAVRAIWKQ